MIDGEHAIPLTALRTILSADVLKAGRPAATLCRDGDDVVFAYRPDYLEADDVPAVASTLPLSDGPVRAPAGAVPAFFAGLLPEGCACRPWSPAR